METCQISSHKKALDSVISAGLARGHIANPSATLIVHQVYCTAVRLSGLASLVFSKSELGIIEQHYKSTVKKIHRLHKSTPRSFVYFLAR